MEKNTRFRKVVAKIDAYFGAKPEPEADANAERFVMKPGEVEIIRGGGPVDRAPGERRGTD